MPWTVKYPPAVAKGWSPAQKKRCVSAANAVLSKGGSEAAAIHACIAAAGKSKTASFNLSGTDPIAIRQTPTGLSAWQALGTIEQITLGNVKVPAQRYKKDVIRLGQYIKVSDGLTFAVTPLSLSNWVMQFHHMQENGVKVPIPNGHKNAGNSKENMGWVDKLWVEDGTLWMACTLIGEDAIVTAKRSDVSLHSPPSVIDGKGNAYQRPIAHVALCPDPVVPGLGDFIPLAASMSVHLQEGPAMDILKYLQELGALVGLDPATMTDEATAAKMLAEAVAALVEKNAADADGDAEVGPDGKPVIPASSKPSGTDGKLKEETLTRKFAGTFSDDGKPNPMVVKLMAEGRQMKIDRLVEMNKITAAVAKDLTDQFIGKDGAAVNLALSNGSDGSDFDLMVAAFEKNEPVEPGEKTGAQGGKSMTLSDGNKGDDKPNALVADAERQAKEAKEQRAAVRR